MTYEELKQRQEWSLYQKIDHAVGTIEAFIAYIEKQGKTPYISFSGGKDSTILLDIARRFVRKDIKAIFCNTGNEWPDIIKFIHKWDNVEIIHPKMYMKEVIEKHGFPLISKEQSQYIRQYRETQSERLKDIRINGKVGKNGKKSWMISRKWQFLVDAPFNVSEKCCKCLKKDPFRSYEKNNNYAPIIGIMAEESSLRKRTYIANGGCNSFNKNNLASRPLSIFLDKDIWLYKKEFKIPLCPIYNVPGVKQTGCVTCPFGVQFKNENRYEVLYSLYPKLFKMVMNYTNNGFTLREALHTINVELPDERLF